MKESPQIKLEEKYTLEEIKAFTPIMQAIKANRFDTAQQLTATLPSDFTKERCDEYLHDYPQRDKSKEIETQNAVNLKQENTQPLKKSKRCTLF